MKYAVQILFIDTWLYVLDSQGNSVQSFDSREAAQQAAYSWQRPEGHRAVVRVVKYPEVAANG